MVTRRALLARALDGDPVARAVLELQFEPRAGVPRTPSPMPGASLMGAGVCKVASDLDSNPKIRRAGRLGREVFLFVVRRTNLLELEGRCPVSNVDPWYLAEQLQMPEDEADKGVKGAVAAGLIALEGGEVIICGWGDEWGPCRAQGGEPPKRLRNKGRSQGVGASSTAAERRGDESDGATQTGLDLSTGEGRSPATTGLTLRAPQRRTCEHERNAHKPALDAFHRYYVQAHGGASPTWGALQVKQIKTLASKHSVAEVMRRIAILSTCPPSWPPGPWDLATFVQHFDKIVTSPRPSPSSSSFFDVIDAMPRSTDALSAPEAS